MDPFSTFWPILLLTTFGTLLDCAVSRDWSNDSSHFNITIKMPDVVSDRTDALLCHSVRLDPREAYILKYEPDATKKVAHHMVVYGCGKPGSTEASWPCGEMDDMSDKSVCSSGAREIVYAWAMDADSVELPEGVGFRVSGTTTIQYLVIQLHYAYVFPEGQTDNSGVTLQMTHTVQPKQAQYYVLGDMGFIPQMTQEYHLESGCDYTNDYTIYPVGYRTHSHNLGVVTSGYRIRDGVWTEIGRMSPQLPQTFYNVTNPGIDVKKGDVLASRCTMSSDREEVTWIGPTNRDEMCNFYILYYTHKRENLKVQYCFRTAQDFHWDDHFTNYPDREASSTDGLPPFKRLDPYAVKGSSSYKSPRNAIAMM